MKTPINQIDFNATSLLAGVIEYYSADGENIVAEAKLLNVLDFIELNRMNISTEGEGLTCDPHSFEREVEQDTMDYLDDNFEMVTRLYFVDKLAGKELSHAA